jgi:GntR family transcriptional regulator
VTNVRPAPIFTPDTSQPLWVRAAETIAREIADGRLPDGARLPAERELCQRLEISRVTLRKALQKLVADGVVTSSHGRGWYVGRGGDAGVTRREWPTTLESFSETAARLGLSSSSLVLRSEVGPATIDEAEQLGIAPASPVLRLERVRMLGGMAIAIDASCLPAALLPPIEGVDLARVSLYELLGTAGHDPAFAETTIESREADADFATHVGVEAGSPVLVLRQLVRSADERPVLASTVRYAGDRYRLRTVFTRSTPGGRAR